MLGRPLPHRQSARGGRRLTAAVAVAAAFALGAAGLRFVPRLAGAPPPGVLVALAGAAAVGAAAAGADPTGLAAVNLLGAAALGAALVPTAGRAGPATTLVAAALAAACSGGSTAAAVAAGGGAGLLLAVVAAGVAAPALVALAGGALAQAVLRFEWPRFTGGPALAATLVLAPVLLVALARGPARPRRLAGRAAGVAVLVGGAASSLAVVAAVGGRSAVNDGVRAAREGLVAVERADRPAAVERFQAAAAAFRRADRSIGAWWARPALAVPVVGQHARALSTLARSGADLAAVGAETAREADPSAVRVGGGAVDLDAVAALRTPLERALASLERAGRRLDDIRSPWLVEPVAERVRELDEKVRSASRSTRTAVLAVRAAPGLLGADGPRRYFLAVVTPAEARATGGLIGNWGELVTEGGRIQLTRVGRVQELNTGGNPEARRIRGEAEYQRRYRTYRPWRYWQSVTFSPDFPTVARVIGDLYPQSGGTRVDGVISVDPHGLAALLRLVGPVPVEGRAEPLTAGNAAAVLLHEQYVAFAEPDRVDFLGTATRAIFDRLVSTTLPPPRALGEALAPAVAGRHLQLASARPGEQAFFAHIGADGALPPVRGDALGVVTQNFNGNKIDWFLRRSWSYDVAYDPGTGATRAVLEVRLRNDAPAEGLPRSVIGFGGPVDLGHTTRFGENFLLLSAYSPLRLDRMTVEGRQVAASQENELGRRVYSTYVSVPARSTRRVRFELSGRLPSGPSYRLDVARQPTVAPDEGRVSVRLVGGWAVRRADGLAGDGRGGGTGAGGGAGGRGTGRLVVDRNRTVELDLERDAGGLVERLRTGR